MSDISKNIQGLKSVPNDPKWQEKIEKRQQQEKEERIQRKLDKLIKEEERKGRRTLRELFASRYEEQIERLRRKAISLVQIDEEERLQCKIDEKIKEMQEGATLTLREIWGEEEMERMCASEMIQVRIEIRQEEHELKLEEAKRQLEEERIQKIEEIRKIGENPNKPLTMKDIYLICPGFDHEILKRACYDLNLEMAKRIARETYANKFKRMN